MRELIELTCIKCGGELIVQEDGASAICRDCGGIFEIPREYRGRIVHKKDAPAQVNKLPTFASSTNKEVRPVSSRKIKYPALDFVVDINRAFAWALLIGGVGIGGVVFFLVLSYATSTPAASLFVSGVGLFIATIIAAGSVLFSLIIFAFCESIKVILDIEENTRSIREGLSNTRSDL